MAPLQGPVSERVHSPSPAVSCPLCGSLRSCSDLGRQRPLRRSRSVALPSPLPNTTRESVKLDQTDALMPARIGWLQGLQGVHPAPGAVLHRDFGTSRSSCDDSGHPRH